MRDYICGMCEFEVKGKCYALPPVVMMGPSGTTYYVRPSVEADDHACTKFMKSAAKFAAKKTEFQRQEREQQVLKWRNAGCCEGCGGSPIPGDRLCPSCEEAEEDAMACPQCGGPSDGDTCDGCRATSDEEQG
jgi:hypothetical protein